MSTSYTIRRYTGVPVSRSIVPYDARAAETPSVVSFGSSVASTISPGSSVSAHTRRMSSPGPARRRRFQQLVPDDDHRSARLQPSGRSHKGNRSRQDGYHTIHSHAGSGSGSSGSLVIVAPSATQSTEGGWLSVASRGTTKSTTKSTTSTPSRRALSPPPSTLSSASSSSSSSSSSATPSTHSPTSANLTSLNTRDLQLANSPLILTLPHDEARLAAYMTYLTRVENVDPASATAYLATRQDCTGAARRLEILASADDGGAAAELFVTDLLRKHRAVCRRVIWRGHRRDEELERWLADFCADRWDWPGSKARGRR